MSFVKKIWKNRQVEHAGRVLMIPTGTANEYDVTRSEGEVTVAGDMFNEETMNDLEDRIDRGIGDAVSDTIAAREKVEQDVQIVGQTKTQVEQTASVVARDKTQTEDYRDQAKEYRDQAAGYAGAATYSFMVDSEGFLCLHYKPDSN